MYKSRTGQEVELERYMWIAQYNDDSVLMQFNDDDNTFHNFDEIDQSKLKTFRMVNTTDPKVFFDIRFNPETMKLIHFYRNQRLRIGAEDLKIRLYCFGYEKKDSVVLNFILPDGGLVTADDKNFVFNFTVS